VGCGDHALALDPVLMGGKSRAPLDIKKQLPKVGMTEV
jgi:hypothetical protein